MQKIFKYTLTSCLIIGFFSNVKGRSFSKASDRDHIEKSEDTLSVKKDFVGIGPAFYELPPEKTKAQLLEEEYDKKHAGSDAVAKILEEKKLISMLQQTSQIYPLPSNTLNSSFGKADLENSLQRSLQSYLQLGNMEMVSDLQNRLAILQAEDKAYEKAINSFQRALSIKEELKDFQSQAVISNNLGVLYNFLDNTEQAFTYYTLMNKAALRANAIGSEATAIEQLAILKARKGNYHEAERDIIKKVLPLYKRIRNVSGRVGAYNNLALIYLAEKKYTESRWFHLQAVKVASMSGNHHREMSYSLYNLGKVKKILKEYTLAISDYTSAATYALQGKDELLRLCICDDLGDIYMQTKDYVKASAYLEEYDSIKRNLFPTNKPTDIALRSDGNSPVAVMP